jgi:hypothetical protein
MSIRKTVLFALVFLGLIGVLAFGIHTLTQGNNLGTDFYIFWQAGRATYLEHTSPYSDEIATRSQLAIFKRLAKPGEDQLAFVYPPYALLAILPVIALPFDWAQAVWIAFLLIALATAFALAYPHAPRWVGLSFLAFYPVFFGLILGNYAILIAALLVILFGLYLPQARPSTAWQLGAGVLCGWLTVKPQFTWPFLLFFGLYALKVKQWKFLAALAASFLVLIGVSFLLVPNWPDEWLARITKYTAYNQAFPIATFLLKDLFSLNVAAWLSAGLGLACAALTILLARRWWRGTLAPLPLIAWLGFVGYLFHPRGASYEQIAFLLPLALWACTAPRSWAVAAWWIASLIVSWIAFGVSVSVPLVSATEWPVLFHVAWIGWVLWGALGINRKGAMTIISPTV